MIDIEIKDLKYVSAIAKYESISQAANELYITQPSLSGYLKNLENRMGLPLFQRIGKRMVLTYFGECFLKEGNDLLLRHKHFSEELDRFPHSSWNLASSRNPSALFRRISQCGNPLLRRRCIYPGPIDSAGRTGYWIF